jgi:aryl-alcohol dehydrogenase-like predicted oxidoreductase
MESGVNWVDTADEYHATANESVIGEALDGMPEQPLISSKRWPVGDSFTPAGIHAGCRASLRRLGVDHLDLYFLHWPDDQIPLQESWGAMAELTDQGLVRPIGLSNYTLAQIEACHAARDPGRSVARRLPREPAQGRRLRVAGHRLRDL